MKSFTSTRGKLCFRVSVTERETENRVKRCWWKWEVIDLAGRKEGKFSSAADESILGLLRLWLAFTSVNAEWQLAPISWLIQNEALAHARCAQRHERMPIICLSTHKLTVVRVQMSTCPLLCVLGGTNVDLKDTLTCMGTRTLAGLHVHESPLFQQATVGLVLSTAKVKPICASENKLSFHYDLSFSLLLSSLSLLLCVFLSSVAADSLYQ